ncbi:MAG: GNAT family N-acetyltransferase [Pseudomonadota bacterium]
MTTLQAVNLADLDTETRDRLSRCSVSEAQEDFGGTFAESIETWRTADPETTLGLAFTLGRDPIGITLLKRPPTAPEWVGPYAASLHGLKIATEAQGNGHGRSAFTLAIKAAQARWPDLRQLILAVDAHNAAALGLYRSLGMRDSGPVFQGRIGAEHRLELDLG